MGAQCAICGKKKTMGYTLARRGLAKKKGGVGRKITGKTKRRFHPNIQLVRVLEANGAVRRARLCTCCLRTGLKKGTIEKVPRKPRPQKTEPAPPSLVALEPEAVLEPGAVPSESEAAADAAPGEGDWEVPPEVDADASGPEETASE